MPGSDHARTVQARTSMVVDKNDMTLHRQESDKPIENNSAAEATRGTYHLILNNSVLSGNDFLQAARGTRSKPGRPANRTVRARQGRGSKRAALAIRRSNVNAGRGCVDMTAPSRANGRSPKLCERGPVVLLSSVGWPPAGGKYYGV